MRLKHIVFSGLVGPERDCWIASQRTWLTRSIGSGGLLAAYAAESHGHARAVFAWQDQAALDGFMERVHDDALVDAGSVGRAAVLYLEPVTILRAPGLCAPGAAEPLPIPPGAAYVGETVAWVREEGDEAWLESQRAWNLALETADGFLGGYVARSRRAFVVSSFWRDEASHERYERVVVPGLRDRTKGDEQTVRLLRFRGSTLAELAYPRDGSG
jgi:hypothetical protein